MKQISGEEKTERLLEHLRTRNLAILQINALTRLGRDELMGIISRVFAEFMLQMDYMFNIYSALVEVIFNGIKANVKYIIFKDELRKKLASQIEDNVIDEMLHIILQEEPLRDFMNRHVVPEKMKMRTMSILKWEEKHRIKKNPLSKEELAKLKEFRSQLQSEQMDVYFTIALGKNTIIFSVVNQSPILTKDLNRLIKSREIHQELAQKGNSGEFFSPEYLDTTESAGMGIAMADEVYYEMKLDPLKHFTIDTEADTTRAVLRFPASMLRMQI